MHQYRRGELVFDVTDNGPVLTGPVSSPVTLGHLLTGKEGEWLGTWPLQAAKGCGGCALTWCRV